MALHVSSRSAFQLGGLGLALGGGADETACVEIGELRGKTDWLLGLLSPLREDACDGGDWSPHVVLDLAVRETCLT